MEWNEQDQLNESSDSSDNESAADEQNSDNESSDDGKNETAPEENRVSIRSYFSKSKIRNSVKII